MNPLLVRVSRVRPANIIQLQRGCGWGWWGRYHRYDPQTEQAIQEFKEDVYKFKTNLKESMKRHHDWHQQRNDVLKTEYNNHHRDWFGRDVDSNIARSPSTVVNETGSAFEVEIELPGIKKDEVKITFSKDKLIVSTVKEEATATTSAADAGAKKSNKKFYSKEIQFHEQVNFKNIKARLEDGILYVTVPKELVDQSITIQ
ncbi:hypothetical protein SAMD00019534_011490 [Acytostelium subglobosum LB1]|uniref:hypothetical protein n=1 Tax=Acytostelium subglobosum LB1 TaxID=1410327 RepID=UPI000644F1B0|nr:hypothetical protein SAMD00019534_011490 [Acytostelium subglobosum LB1]GAM17974.1 hypothetical protein SAMD00019534_011490 [Acytostelium subglobosum LB1]|eukprot:XP_012758570.1 hypothetical protein SAMD00019534_011490 [Acytostelium subglobosum LB1]